MAQPRLPPLPRPLLPQVGNGDVVSVERAHQLLRETGCHGLMLGRGAVHDPLLFLRIRLSFAEDAATAGAAAAAGDAASGVADWRGREPELIQDFLFAYASQLIPELADGTLPPPPYTSRPSSNATRGTLGEVLAGCEGAAARGGLAGASGVAADRRGGDRGGGGCDDGGGGGAGVDPGGLGEAARTFGRLKVVMRYLFASSPQLAAACEALLRRTPRDCSAPELVAQLSEEVARGWPRGGPTRRVLYDHMNKSVRELVVTS